VNGNSLGRYWASYAADTGDGEPNNALVLFEEAGGDPRRAAFCIVVVGHVCVAGAKVEDDVTLSCGGHGRVFTAAMAGQAHSHDVGRAAGQASHVVAQAGRAHVQDAGRAARRRRPRPGRQPRLARRPPRQWHPRRLGLEGEDEEGQLNMKN
jgi:hypothetical protein